MAIITISSVDLCLIRRSFLKEAICFCYFLIKSIILRTCVFAITIYQKFVMADKPRKSSTPPFMILMVTKNLSQYRDRFSYKSGAFTTPCKNSTSLIHFLKFLSSVDYAAQPCFFPSSPRTIQHHFHINQLGTLFNYI